MPPALNPLFAETVLLVTVDVAAEENGPLGLVPWLRLTRPAPQPPKSAPAPLSALSTTVTVAPRLTTSLVRPDVFTVIPLRVTLRPGSTCTMVATTVVLAPAPATVTLLFTSSTAPGA